MLKNEICFPFLFLKNKKSDQAADDGLDCVSSYAKIIYFLFVFFLFSFSICNSLDGLWLFSSNLELQKLELLSCFLSEILIEIYIQYIIKDRLHDQTTMADLYLLLCFVHFSITETL